MDYRLRKNIWIAAMLGMVAVAQAQPPAFDRAKDLLLLQHDMGNDPDDLCAVTVETCMLLHPDYMDVNFFVVAGTRNPATMGWLDECRPLLPVLLGPKGEYWTDAETPAQWNAARDNVKARVATVLHDGGRVWVVEAGTSDFSRDWLKLLEQDTGVDNALLLSHVVVVQHSRTNESNTDPADLTYVKNKTDYYLIDAGKKENGTPKYLDTDLSYRQVARASGNPNEFARTAFRAMDVALETATGNPTLRPGGIDFTDSVEMWWALDMGAPAGSVASVWDHFVLNEVVIPGGGTIDGDDAAVTYAGNWTSQADAGDYAGSMKYSGTAGDYVEYSFHGTFIQVGVRKGASGGLCDVYIDGALAAENVDTYAADKVYQAVIFEKELAPGTHTVRLQATGRKNPAAKRSYAMFDFFYVGERAMSVAKAYTWDDGAEPVTLHQMTASVAGGVMALTLNAADNDPYMVMTGADVDAANSRIELRVKNGTSGTAWKMYFAPAGGTFAGNYVSFNVPAFSDWQSVVIDMTADPDYAGTIAAIRLDPQGNVAGTIEVDSVKMMAP